MAGDHVVSDWATIGKCHRIGTERVHQFAALDDACEGWRFGDVELDGTFDFLSFAGDMFEQAIFGLHHRNQFLQHAR